MSNKYKNRLTINQRGASIEINNTTDNESIQLSQRSGSNITINNLVNSELASNNKQVRVVHDDFKTVGNDENDYVGRDKITRVQRNTYSYKGFSNDVHIKKYKEWKETYRKIAENNSQFRICRGGVSNPNGVETPLAGVRDGNPVIDKSKSLSVNSKFRGYRRTPYRSSLLDQVVTYATVPARNDVAEEVGITVSDLNAAGGESQYASNAPGIVKYGAGISASTENGQWAINTTSTTIDQQQVAIQDELNQIEQQMGDGGDENNFIKRNKFENIGVVFNDYPSIRIDPEGRSQPFEMLVAPKGTFKNHDSVPHVEEVDNSSNFPCGNDIKVVGNSYKRSVGSGGIGLKTTGALELGGTTCKISGNKVSIDASHGIHIASENGVEIQSLKTITLRTNRQVYVESALGVKNNLIVGGGMSVEGETYLHHVTAPVEIQETEDMILYGKFNTRRDRRLQIGECKIGPYWYPVYAMASDDLIINYPHSHHFKNLPLKLMNSNKEVREMAMGNYINQHKTVAQAAGPLDERK